jgi:hypothetical protein
MAKFRYNCISDDVEEYQETSDDTGRVNCAKGVLNAVAFVDQTGLSGTAAAVMNSTCDSVEMRRTFSEFRGLRTDNLCNFILLTDWFIIIVNLKALLNFPLTSQYELVFISIHLEFDLTFIKQCTSSLRAMIRKSKKKFSYLLN